MKIAFTHNLQLTDSEEEAEFDRPETVLSITRALRNLGHDVEPLDVAGPASLLVARLEALSPDLIFNTAEGTKGRFREAFYPALFERLGMAYTGSDAYACALTLDKQLTKMIVASAGVPTPRWSFVERAQDVQGVQRKELRYPLIVKPNFEGSSMGIGEKNIVEDAAGLKRIVEDMLPRFPEGLIVEEFVAGFDLTVPYLEKASPGTGGVLEPSGYEFDEELRSSRRYLIYDYEMKATHYDHVKVVVPAGISPEQRRTAMELTGRVVKVLNIRDMARVDFRVDGAGQLNFIEVNALPSFEPGASLYASAARAGLGTTEKVLGSILQSAAERYGLEIKTLKRKGRRSGVRVGLTFNLKRVDNSLEANGDTEAEYDSPETIAAISEAITSYGHEVVELEATPELPSKLPGAGIDMVFNVAEGIVGRSRESQVPAMLELLGIPYTGSDPATMALALDKGLAKRLVTQAGMKTPPFLLMISGRERLPKNFTFPVVVKPVAEGSSKGVISKGVVEDEAQLRSMVQETASRYKQPVMAESYLPGREFTVAMLGERRPRVLPLMEVVFTEESDRFKLYSFESKFFNKGIRFEVPANVEDKLRQEIEQVAKSIFTVLGCRDLARIDLRLDERGNVNFVECNPLPGLAPGFSDFCVIAEKAGMDFRTLIGEIMAPGLRRMRELRKQKLMIGRQG